MNIKFLDILEESFKSDRDIGATEKVELKVPTLEKANRIANAKWQRESKFKKMKEDSYFFLDPSEGFFAHYSPNNNYYFESNASFSFIVDEGPATTRKNTWRDQHAPYSFERISHPKLGHKDINLKVLKSNKKVKLEKVWSGSKLRAQAMDDAIAYIDAFKALVKFHPEIESYTFSDKKMKVKEFIKSGPETLEAGGEHSVYFIATGEEAKKIMSDGDVKGIVYFDKKVARRNAKLLTPKNVYNAWAILDLKVKGTDGFQGSYGDGFRFENKLEPSRISLESSNYPKFFKKDFKPAEELNFSKYDNVYSTKNWDKILRAGNQEEFDYFETELRKEEHLRRGQGQRTRTTWPSSPGIVQLILKNNLDILLLKPEITEEDMKKFFAKRWYRNLSMFHELDWRKRDEPGVAYDIVFNHKVPDWMAHKSIELAFGDEHDINKVKSAYPLPTIKDAE